MQKAELLSQIAQAGLSPDVAQEITSKVNTYPEQLTPEQVTEVDQYLSEQQETEHRLAEALDFAADTIEESNLNGADAQEEFLEGSASAMRNELKRIEEIAPVKGTTTQPPQTPPPAAPVG